MLAVHSDFGNNALNSVMNKEICLTSANQLCNMSVACHFAWGYLLHGAVDRVKECRCFVGAGHCEI